MLLLRGDLHVQLFRHELLVRPLVLVLVLVALSVVGVLVLVGVGRQGGGELDGDDEDEEEQGGGGDHLDLTLLNNSASNQCHSERLRGGRDAKTAADFLQISHFFDIPSFLKIVTAKLPLQISRHLARIF